MEDNIINNIYNKKIIKKNKQQPEEITDKHYAIVDSAATAHVFSDECTDIMKDAYKRKSYISTANDQIMTGEWAIKKGIMGEILFHEANRNLISAPKLVERGCKVTFDKISTIEIADVKVKMNRLDDLFYINKSDLIRLTEIEVEKAYSAEVKKSITRTPAIVRGLPPWYRRRIDNDRPRITQSGQEKRMEVETMTDPDPPQLEGTFEMTENSEEVQESEPIT